MRLMGICFLRAPMYSALRGNWLAAAKCAHCLRLMSPYLARNMYAREPCYGPTRFLRVASG